MIKTLRNLRRQDKDKFRIPRSVQDAIPVQSLWKNGVFLVGQNRFSKSWQFTDINYGTADDEDKKSMFLAYSELLNSFDSNAYTKISIITRKLNRRDFEKNILIPMKHDEFDRLRKEYNAMLMEKAANGSGMIRDMYITITVVRKNYEEAKNFFTRVGAELNMHLSRLGSRCTELSAEDRLRILHGFYRHGEEADFHFDLAETARKGHSFKDYMMIHSRTQSASRKSIENIQMIRPTGTHKFAVISGRKCARVFSTSSTLSTNTVFSLPLPFLSK